MRKSGHARRLDSQALLGWRCARRRHAAWRRPRSRNTAARSRSAPSIVTLSALSWDLADWNWKQNHDTGQFYEQLFAADLSKSKRNGGKHPFYADAWLPSDAIRGELAESWEWKDNPLRVEIKLRKGIMFPEKPGVMAARELTADDVVFSYNRLAKSPKKIADLLRPCREGRRARPAHRRVHSSRTSTPSGTIASAGATTRAIDAQGGRRRRRRQLEERERHRPVHAHRLRAGQLQHLREESRSTGTRRRSAASEYKLPFVDKLVYRTIKDEATFVTALRTAKLDILETIRWQNVEQLKKSAPQLQVVAVAQHVGHVPGDARRHQAVRRHPRAPRAQHGGQQAGDRLGATTTATPSCSPIRSIPTIIGYFEPLETMPDSVKELFTYNPAKAKKLLAEAGYPNGFSFKVQVCSCNPDHMDLLPLVAAYLEQVGVKIEIQPMEYGAFLSAMTHARPTRPATS